VNVVVVVKYAIKQRE